MALIVAGGAERVAVNLRGCQALALQVLADILNQANRPAQVGLGIAACWLGQLREQRAACAAPVAVAGCLREHRGKAEGARPLPGELGDLLQGIQVVLAAGAEQQPYRTLAAIGQRLLQQGEKGRQSTAGSHQE